MGSMPQQLVACLLTDIIETHHDQDKAVKHIMHGWMDVGSVAVDWISISSEGAVKAR